MVQSKLFKKCKASTGKMHKYSPESKKIANPQTQNATFSLQRGTRFYMGPQNILCHHFNAANKIEFLGNLGFLAPILEIERNSATINHIETLPMIS